MERIKRDLICRCDNMSNADQMGKVRTRRSGLGTSPLFERHVTQGPSPTTLRGYSGLATVDWSGLAGAIGILPNQRLCRVS